MCHLHVRPLGFVSLTRAYPVLRGSRPMKESRKAECPSQQVCRTRHQLYSGKEYRNTLHADYGCNQTRSTEPHTLIRPDKEHTTTPGTQSVSDKAFLNRNMGEACPQLLHRRHVNVAAEGNVEQAQVVAALKHGRHAQTCQVA